MKPTLFTKRQKAIDRMQQLLVELNAALSTRPIGAAFFHFVFCACLGSYFNLFAWRWPQMQERQWLGDIGEWFSEKGWPLPPAPAPSPAKLTLSTPGSFCPSCGTPISWRYNLPVLGWLILRGKSACCGEKISIKYPLFEAMCGGLGLFAWLYYGNAQEAWLFLLLAMPLCMASQTDFESMMLPDSITAFILFSGIALAIFGLSSVSPQTSLVGAAAAFASLSLVRTLGSLAFKREAMGQGDPKLFAAIGAWIGWTTLPQALLLAAIAGLLYAVAVRATSTGQGKAIPFGPFLAIGGLVCYVWGQQLLHMF